MPHIFLVMFDDEPTETMSAWSTKELAETEIQRILDEEKGGPDPSYWYYLQNRLRVETVELRA